MYKKALKVLRLLLVVFTASILIFGVIEIDAEVPLQFYFGQLHSHTSYSDVSGTPDEAYTWAFGSYE